jgi:tungstate transport system substrate-binding protein
LAYQLLFQGLLSHSPGERTMSKFRISNLFLLILLSLMLLCAGIAQAAAPTDNKVIKMATTTSTENSGLLGYLLPAFEKETGYTVHVIAVGTGKALRMGCDGDVDVVLVHARKAENKFIADGCGVKRFSVMYNDFVLVGPKSDPAGVDHDKNIVQALTRIADHKAIFVSRGDDSGTNKKELALWKDAGITPSGSWYREAGQGMGKVLQMAGELDAYTLTDRGTWIAYRDKSPLVIVSEGDKRLQNPYGIIAVSPKRFPDLNNTGANAIIAWITSKHGQQLIGSYKLSGDQLFTPSADPSEK